MKRNPKLALLSFLSGGLLVLAFAPFNLWLLGFICPALFLVALLRATPGQALWRGFLFGLAEFGFGTSWIYISIHKFGNANVFLAGLITSLFILLMSSYPALQAYFFAKCFRNKAPFARCCLAFPALWVSFEVLRSYLFTGFPWLALGYSQTNTMLSAYAPLVSVFGLSLLVSFMSGTLVYLISPHGIFRKFMLLLVVAGLTYLAWPLHKMSWTQDYEKPLSIAMVQGNIPQSLKWDPNEVSRTIQKYMAITEPYWRTDLIIWPEAAVPLLRSHATGLIEELDAMAKQNQATLVFGIPIDDAQNHYYNGLLAVGLGQGSYLKRHPVPFGEYIPLQSLFGRLMRYFDIPMSDLSKGPAEQALISVDHSKLAPFVCYEVTYPNEVVKYSRGSQFLVVVNDDSWFGDSLAQPQQIEMARMRTLETGRPMLYASNTGITAIISKRGEITAVAPENVVAVLTGTVQPVIGDTPLMRWYFYPLIGLVIFMLLLALMCRVD